MENGDSKLKYRLSEIYNPAWVSAKLAASLADKYVSEHEPVSFDQPSVSGFRQVGRACSLVVKSLAVELIAWLNC